MNPKGITLIEMIVVIMMVGILAAIAVPIYTGYLQRARRADAKATLEQFRASQEMRRSERGTYSTDLNELQNTWGVTVALTYYNIQFSGVSNPNTWTAQADSIGTQAADGDLFINYRGQKWDGDGLFYPQGKWAK